MKSRCRLALLSLLSFVGILGSTGTASSASPREELLRLVPADAGFCLVISDLRSHADHLLHSPWFQDFQKTPLWQACRSSPELIKLDKFLEQELPRTLQIDWPRLRDDVLGDALVFAYRPDPSGKSDKENGLFLLRARNGQLLADLVNRLNQVQLKSGEVRAVESQRYQGKEYVIRRVPKGAVESAQYYYLDGPLLAFSTDRGVLLRVIETHVGRTAARPTLVSAQLARAGADKALAAWWINPRVFDRAIQEHAGRAHAAEAQGLNGFFRYWKALDGLVLSLETAPDFAVRMSLQGRPEDLPAAGRRFLTSLGRPSDLWRRFPSDTIFALALRIDAAALGNAFAEFLTPEERQQNTHVLQQTLGAAMGMEISDSVLERIGPDVGLCVAAPPLPSRFPQLLAALRVSPGTTTLPVDQALLKTLRFFAHVAVFDHNRRTGDQVRLETVVQEGVEVSYLTGSKSLPAELQPALALKSGYLVLGSSPDAIRRFRQGDGGTLPERQVPFLRLSIPELTRFLEERRQFFSSLMGERNPANDQALDHLIRTLALFERLEVTQQAQSGQMLLTVRLQKRR